MYKKQDEAVLIFDRFCAYNYIKILLQNQTLPESQLSHFVTHKFAKKIILKTYWIF